MSDVEHEVHLKARDHGRIPIAREASERNAGFSGTTSALWTPMNLDADVCSVAAQDKRTDSVPNFRWKMLAFRKQHTETLVFGDFEPLSPDDTTVFAYWQKAVQGNRNRDVGNPEHDCEVQYLFHPVWRWLIHRVAEHKYGLADKRCHDLKEWAVCFVVGFRGNGSRM
jgi:glycosidase